jgi:hypothetical protein
MKLALVDLNVPGLEATVKEAGAYFLSFGFIKGVWIVKFFFEQASRSQTS